MSNTINLFTIRLDSDNKINQQQLDQLKELHIDIEWKVEKDFDIYVYDSDTAEERERKVAQSATKWKAYQESKVREFKSPYEIHGVDISLIAEHFPYLKYTVLGNTKVKLRQNSISIDRDWNRLEDMIKQFKQTAENSGLAVTEAKSFNNKCNVHIGGSLLMNVNELLLCENYCTDDAQNQINDGWRIVAVCVQPDGRRPDYIFGRYNPNMSAEGKSALRP